MLSKRYLFTLGVVILLVFVVAPRQGENPLGYLFLFGPLIVVDVLWRRAKGVSPPGWLLVAIAFVWVPASVWMNSRWLHF